MNIEVKEAPAIGAQTSELLSKVLSGEADLLEFDVPTELVVI